MKLTRRKRRTHGKRAAARKLAQLARWSAEYAIAYERWAAKDAYERLTPPVVPRTFFLSDDR